MAHATATAPSRHRHRAARGPVLPKETAPTCTAGKQEARRPEEGGRRRGAEEAGQNAGGWGGGGAEVESQAKPRTLVARLLVPRAKATGYKSQESCVTSSLLHLLFSSLLLL